MHKVEVIYRGQGLLVFDNDQLVLENRILQLQKCVFVYVV